MKLIDEADLEEYTDESGDKLFCIKSPRRVDVLRSGALAYGMNSGDFDPTKVDLVAISEQKFTAVMRKMIIGGTVVEGDDLKEVYRQLDPESGAWVSEVVNEIWYRIEPGEEKKA